jgi:hypothetical protein
VIQIAPRSRPDLLEVVRRSVVVGFVYALASSVIAAVLGPLSRLRPSLDNFAIWMLSGALVCLCLAPFIVSSSWSRWRTVLAAWAVIAFVRSLGLGIEASLFKPSQMDTAIPGAAFGILIGLLVAWLSVSLLMPLESEPAAQSPIKRTWLGWTWRVLLVGLAYFVFYFVFGATNALLYTRAFYENNQQYGLSLPPAGVIFLAQLIRGPLFGLGALFIVRASALPRGKAGVWLGLLLFVVGGLGPYLETTFRTMPLGFNLATVLELFLQHFLTGVVAARLYR